MTYAPANLHSRLASRAKQTSSSDALDASTKVGLRLLLISGVIDYRFVNASPITVALYVIIALLSVAGTAILVFKYGLKRGSFLNLSALICGLFFIDAIAVGILRGQDVLALIRNAPPLLFLPLPFLAISALWNGKRDTHAVWRFVFKAGFIALFTQLAFVVLERGINFSTVRYEILSGAAPLLTGYAVAAILFGGLTTAAGVVLIAHFGTVLLSVTRTQLAVALAAVVSAIAFAGPAALDPRRLLKGLFSAVGALAVIFVIGSALPGAPLERWAYRTVGMTEQHHGIDITKVTRQGEAGYQLEQLKASTSGLLFGFGAAAPTAFDSETQRIVALILGIKSSKWGEAGLGHNNYVGTLYIGGLLTGGAMFILQAIGLIKTLQTLRKLSGPNFISKHRILLSAPISYICYLTFGALAGTFGQRSGSLYFALSLAMTIWISELLRDGKKSSATRRIPIKSGQPA